MIACRVVVVAAVAATLGWTAGALGLYHDFFPTSADGQMDTYYDEGYAISGYGAARLSKSDHHFPFMGFDALSDGVDGIADGKAGDTGDGVLLADWVPGKKVISAKLYVRDFTNGFCDNGDPPGTYINDPITIVGFRVSNVGRFVDRRADGSSPPGGCCADHTSPLVDAGMNTPTAWRMGLQPYTQNGDIGTAGVIGDPPVPVTPEFYTLSWLDSANPGASVDATQSFFDGDGDGFKGASGRINGTDTVLTDGMHAFEYIIRHSDALVINSQTMDAADCVPTFGTEEPRDAAQDGASGMGWYGTPVDPRLVLKLGTDPEMKGLVFSSIGVAGYMNTTYQTRDQNGDNWAPYLDVSATLAGDVDNDGFVGPSDVTDTVTAFGAGPGNPNWNPEADFDGDGLVSIFDVIDAVQNFGQSAP